MSFGGDAEEEGAVWLLLERGWIPKGEGDGDEPCDSIDKSP